ncbi:MAG: hypothetical protein Kapaf2KO_16560 [Candidatus Kapaibacteriales bacterium]
MYYTDKNPQNNLKVLSFLSLVFLFISGCQEVVEPTDVEDEMNLRVEIVNQSNEKLEGSNARYAIAEYDKATPPEALDLISQSNIQSLNGSDGAFYDELDVPVMDVTKGLLVVADPPPSRGQVSYTPLGTQAELMSFCEDTTVIFVFTENSEWDCSINDQEDFELVSNQEDTGYEPALFRSTRFQNFNGAPLTVGGTTTNTDPLVDVFIVIYDATGAEINRVNLAAGPTIVQTNESFEIEVSFNPDVSTNTGDQTINITVTQNGTPCGTLEYDFVARTIDDSGCDCPPSLELSYTLEDPQCMSNDSIIFNIPVSFSNGEDSGCDYVFESENGVSNRLNWSEVGGNTLTENELAAISIIEVDNQILSNGTNFTLEPGDDISYITILIDGTQFQSEGTYQVTGDYKLTLRNENGDENECELIPVNIEFQVLGGQCAILRDNEGAVGVLDRNLLSIRNGVPTVDTVVACRNAYDPSQLRLLYYQNDDPDCEVEVVTRIENVERSVDGITYQSFNGQNDVFSFVKGNDTIRVGRDNETTLNPNSRTADSLAFKPDELSIEPIPGQVYGFWKANVVIQTRYAGGAVICDETIEVFSEVRTGTCGILTGDVGPNGEDLRYNLFPAGYDFSGSNPAFAIDCYSDPVQYSNVYIYNDGDCDIEVILEITDPSGKFGFDGSGKDIDTIILRPNTISSSRIYFDPEIDDLYPGGDFCQDPIDYLFNSRLSIRSQTSVQPNVAANNICDIDVPIGGQVSRDCDGGPADNTLGDYLISPAGFNFILNEDRSVSVQDCAANSCIRSELALYFENINIAAGTAELLSGVPGNTYLNFYRLQTGYVNDGDQQICDLKDDGLCACNEASNQGTRNITVSTGDLIYFTIVFPGYDELCGVIWINDINNVNASGDPVTPTVFFKRCLFVQ